jgi:DNA-binding NarL/FixJ family response regulator
VRYVPNPHEVWIPVTILIVDDNQEFRGIIRHVLQAQSDLSVSGEADDGEAAVEHVRHHQPAVVLMDVAMPRLDGFEATRRIKAMRPDTKVLILTVHREEAYPERARESAADAFLPKQDVITRLIPTIREVLGGGREQNAS